MDPRPLVERYLAAVTTGDTSRLSDIIADDFASFSGHGRGPSSVAKAIDVLRAGFTELAIDLELCVADGEWIALRAVVQGTHTGAFAGCAPTGRRVRWTVADFIRIHDGKIAEVRTLQDNLPLLESLGGAGRLRPSLGDFPAFMKERANPIPASSQLTRDIEGGYFDSASGAQVAFWRAAADRVSDEHAHPFDELVVVLEGSVTVTRDGDERGVELRRGDEMVISAGTRQRMGVRAGTRTLHVFGGRRVRAG